MPFAEALGAVVASVGVGNLVSAGGQIIGGVLGANASTDAAQTQADASNNASQLQAQASREALDFQKGIYADTTANLSPYRDIGSNALAALNASYGFTTPGNGFNGDAFGMAGWKSLHGEAPDITSFAPKFGADPGYAFQFGEGQRALENSASRGLGGGNTMRSLVDYGTGMANKDFWNQFNQANSSYWQNYGAYNQDNINAFNRLSGLAGTGQNAAVQQGGFGTQLGTQVGNNLTNTAAQIGSNTIGAGNAQAAGQVGAANAYGNAFGNIGNSYLTSQYLNAMNGSGSSNNGSAGPGVFNNDSFSIRGLPGTDTNMGVGGSVSGNAFNPGNYPAPQLNFNL